MSELHTALVDDEVQAKPAPLSFKTFLETTHPSVETQVSELWEENGFSNGKHRQVNFPSLRIHCRDCQGIRTFRTPRPKVSVELTFDAVNHHSAYICGDCQNDTKFYSLRLVFGDSPLGLAYKYGELPPFGIPVPNRVRRLFGQVDGDLFMKGRQCENLGYGIGAFGYYRRVVETHRNDLFDEIIKACETVGGSQDLINELLVAKGEISFSKSMEKIKTALPQGLLIGGHNPLLALHKALSVGLHGETDEACLGYAQAIRIVLSDLVERIAALKTENAQLKDAVIRLLAK